MPKVRFLVSTSADAQNRNGWNAGDEVWMSAAEAERRLDANEVELLEMDPTAEPPAAADVAEPTAATDDQE